MRDSAESKAKVAARLPPDETAVSRALRAANRFCARAGLHRDAGHRLLMVVEEWVANIVEHGEPDEDSRILVTFLRDGEILSIAFSDTGCPFDPTAALFDGPNPERGGGAGIAMIAGLTRMTYQRRAGRNHLQLEMPLA